MNDLLLRALRRESVERIPVWFMRQAGRTLPGYRALRQKHGVLELAQTPQLAAQISLEPIERFGVDAAILFADIMLLPIAMGADVEIIDSIGPVVAHPITNAQDIDDLKLLQRKNIAYLEETIRILRGKLQVPLIGFSGAPFTLASYLIEGKPTRTWSKTKRFMLEEPEQWSALMTKLSDGVIEYLCAQIDAGAQAVQLFDSWVGCLSPAQYRAQVLPHVQRIFSALNAKNVPRIHFATDTAGMLASFTDVDCEAIGVDWRISLQDARKIVGGKTLQGNLDPTVLLGSWPRVQSSVDEMLDGLDVRKGYIFNLGHGILPETNEAIIEKLVAYVHSK